MGQILLEKERADGLVAELRRLSLMDSLTGLGNRRSFDEHLEREWRRARHDDTALALLLIDVDHFKAYNDRYGHHQGDRCLVHVADVLRAMVGREGDLAARYGGEEFALIIGPQHGGECDRCRQSDARGDASTCHSASGIADRLRGHHQRGCGLCQGPCRGRSIEHFVGS
ncbi:MAG: GGDEF domain-containing protein [Pseudomonadota bacterium]